MESEISLENWSERREEGVGEIRGGGEGNESRQPIEIKSCGGAMEGINSNSRAISVDQVSYSSRINRSGTVVPRFDNIRVGFSLRFFPRVSFSHACSTNEIPPGTRNYRGDKIFQG